LDVFSQKRDAALHRFEEMGEVTEIIVTGPSAELFSAAPDLLSL
jgi:hypothetical protein